MSNLHNLRNHTYTHTHTHTHTYRASITIMMIPIPHTAHPGRGTNVILITIRDNDYYHKGQSLSLSPQGTSIMIITTIQRS